MGGVWVRAGALFGLSPPQNLPRPQTLAPPLPLPPPPPFFADWKDGSPPKGSYQPPTQKLLGR